MTGAWLQTLYMANKTINTWKLLKLIGAGGNGEVWECADPSGEVFAMKILQKTTKVAYQRFMDEVAVMRSHMGKDGIMPVIDFNLPASYDQIKPDDIIYYVMPLATPAKERLFGSSFAEKQNAIRDILKMLCRLHHQGIAHRDIKIENILMYQEHYVLSDFGLVFYQDKPRVTKTDERLGAKRTLAPEMERPGSKNADPFKADVYSIAKTIWVILTEHQDSFEGQYSRNQVIRLVDNVKCPHDTYFTPLDDLLAECTDVEPSLRPDIDQVLARYEEWEKIQDDFAKSNRSQWVEVIRALFPYSVPNHAEWTNIEDIKNVLNMVSHYESLNHLFFPSGGGLDLTSVTDSFEDHCLELVFGGLHHIVNPKVLYFESIGDDLLWNYFRLECNPMKPASKKTPEDSFDEGVSEIKPLEYVDYEVLEDHDWARQHGYEVNEMSRQIERQLKGSFVIFSKNSLYNRTSATYDGRHETMDSATFREYIKRVYSKYKQAPDNAYLTNFRI